MKVKNHAVLKTFINDKFRWKGKKKKGIGLGKDIYI